MKKIMLIPLMFVVAIMCGIATVVTFWDGFWSSLISLPNVYGEIWQGARSLIKE